MRLQHLGRALKTAPAHNQGIGPNRPAKRSRAALVQTPAAPQRRLKASPVARLWEPRASGHRRGGGCDGRRPLDHRDSRLLLFVRLGHRDGSTPVTRTASRHPLVNSYRNAPTRWRSPRG